MFFAHKESLPVNLQSLSIKHSPIHMTRNPMFFKKIKVKSTLKKMCISVYGVQRLCVIVKSCDKLKILKKHIKVIALCKQNKRCIIKMCVGRKCSLNMKLIIIN